MSDLPSRLYHYTNADGVIGIVTNKVVWLTDYRSLNDRSEIDYSLELIQRFITKHPDIKKISDRFEYQSIFKKNRQGQVVLVGSFAESADNPVLWRLYSKQKGYVLGFDPSSLEKSIASMSNARLRKVIYDPSQQEDFVNQSFVEFISSLPSREKNSEEQKKLASVFEKVNFFFWVYKIAPFIKHSSFEHEEEWRIAVLFREKSGVQFRSRDGDIVPYFELEMPTIADSAYAWLRSIDIGPQSDPTKNIAQIEALLDMNGFRNSEIEFGQSTIPI